jgi:hypothetical protein
MQNMSEIKNQIYKELDALESAVARLHGAVQTAGKQTDLEVAILTEQVRTLREKNEHAGELVSKSIKILKDMK